MIGQTISHYTITEKLGEGGMGVVYKAEDTKLERTVALKFLASHLMANEEAGKRFIREAKAAAALDHPNICTVHEIDEVDDHTFIAMAYLEGETLDKRIAAGPVPLDDALDIAIQIARGLEAAHRKSIFHRDIKPANVMLLDQGSERLIKIMDFGLAQLAERSRLTDLDTTLGTMAYMSPEQTEGAGTDQRTDLWALGCVMYEMISGQLPFRGDYNQAVQYSILHEAPDPLTGLRTGVPMELEWIVDKCLAKNREERYPEASALILDVSTLRKKLEAGPLDGGEGRPTAAAERDGNRGRRIICISAGSDSVSPGGIRPGASASPRPRYASRSHRRSGPPVGEISRRREPRFRRRQCRLSRRGHATQAFGDDQRGAGVGGSGSRTAAAHKRSGARGGGCLVPSGTGRDGRVMAANAGGRARALASFRLRNAGRFRPGRLLHATRRHLP